MYFLKIKSNKTVYLLEGESKEKLKKVFIKFVKEKGGILELLLSNAYKIENGFNKELKIIIDNNS